MHTQLSNIELTGLRAIKQRAREKLETNHSLANQIKDRNLPIHLLETLPVSSIDRKVKQGGVLTFDEAFVGMCYVIAATNGVFLSNFAKTLGKAYGVEKLSHDRAIAIGAAFLNLMAVKESFVGLESEEIAGLVAAGLMDTAFSLQTDKVIETCGMGGDKGFEADGDRCKSINVSTLSSFVLASLGCRVAKHGSYANSTVVGSTDSLELFGANTTPKSIESILEMLGKGFCYLDAHLCKTLHDLSHLLMMETINHLVGPMTPPFSRHTPILKIMGVNEKVSPRAVAKAYADLHQRKIQINECSVVIAGLNTFPDEKASSISESALRKLTILDELSPFASLISVSVGDQYLGDDLLTPHDFGVEIDVQAIKVKGDRTIIHTANEVTLKGKSPALTDYLSVNAALGLYVWRYGNSHSVSGSPQLDRALLKACFSECRDAVVSGAAWRTLQEFVASSNS